MRTDRTKRSIAVLTTDCIANFEQLLNSGIETDILENALADFRLWADGVGALARLGASLDSRLRGRQDDLELVKSILAMLLSFLDKLAQITLRENTSDEDCNSLRQDTLWSLDSLLKNLSLIGVAIRRTGKASRSRRAEKNYNSADHEDFRKHLELIVLLGLSTGDHGTRDLKSPNLSGLQNRLIDANLRRRHSFLNAQKHSRSLKDPPKRDDQPDPIHTPESPEKPVAQSISHVAVAKEKSKESPAGPSTTAVQSKASTAEEPIKYMPAKVNHEVAKTQITAIAADAELPRPPSLASGRQIFECPCCCQSIPVSQNWK